MAPSLYIHIPFCEKKCLYCDFYSLASQEKLAADYVRVLIKQIRRIDAPVSSIYIGGGTPSVLGINLLGQLLKSLKKIITPGIEFTIEVNPESFSKKSAELFLENGVNRLSIGLQSFDDQKLRKLGRIHDCRKAQEAVDLAQKSGFKNISIDLIFGVWDEKFPDWKNELQKAVSLPVKHISVYSLTYEKSTPLSKMLKNGLIKPLEDEAVAGMYEYAVDFLEGRGFKRYEVSNFARDGYICRHNCGYWQNESYAGIGPSAVSYLDGVRKKNIPDVKEYIARIKKGSSVIKSQEKLSVVQKAKETAALKIRTKEGISLEWFKEKTGFDFLRLEKSSITGLREKELIDYEKKDGKIKRVSLTKKGFLFCDIVSSELL
ncbi:MAG: radical SAM family heme chaperone HemW [Candidatus Omnitrophota bacterium]|nr:radical SAM family heme chaperone HemW [Candidatus Omnitrophota bacterium]